MDRDVETAAEHEVSAAFAAEKAGGAADAQAAALVCAGALELARRHDVDLALRALLGAAVAVSGRGPGAVLKKMKRLL